jgi:pyridine nucleotide-disulfide oxidoreductase family protein
VKRLVLFGAGHAHVHVLEALAREPLPAAEVTLVSSFPASTYSGMVPGWVAGHYEARDCTIPLALLAGRARVERIEATGVALDAATRTLTLADGRVLGYDVLSIDTGATVDRDLIPGAREHAMFVRPIEQFLRLCEPLVALAAERSLCVAVIGGGAGGFELACALQHRLGDRARVSLVTGGDAPLASYPDGVRRRGLQALKRWRITVLEDRCVQILPGQVVLGRGTRLACDAPVVALGATPPAWVQGSGLALDEAGFVATGPTLQSRSHPEVFAAGDVASRTDAPHPRSGVYAVRAGPPLALNLRRFVAGGALQPYAPQRRSLNLLSCGDRVAIASWGSWAAEGRWCWWWKDRIDRAFIARFAGPATGITSPSCP